MNYFQVHTSKHQFYIVRDGNGRFHAKKHISKKILHLEVVWNSKYISIAIT